MIGCGCPVCSSADSYNKRLRTSALLSCGQKKLLIDCGPDIRQQALNYHIDTIDGLMITHAHFDHIAGLDELRAFYLHTKKPLPVLLSEPTLNDIKLRCPYFFEKRDPARSLPAQFDFQVVKGERGVADFLGFKIGYMQFSQASMPVLGFRFNDLAYISDIKSYPSTLFEDLDGIEILILSMLEKESSRMHFGLEETLAFVANTTAKKTYLTHIGHRTDHFTMGALLPGNMQLAFDGLKVEFNYGG